MKSKTSVPKDLNINLYNSFINELSSETAIESFRKKLRREAIENNKVYTKAGQANFRSKEYTRNEISLANKIRSLTPKQIKELSEEVKDCITSDKKSDNEIVNKLVKMQLANGEVDNIVMSVIAGADAVAAGKEAESKKLDIFSRTEKWLIGNYRDNPLYNQIVLANRGTRQFFELSEEKTRSLKHRIGKSVAITLAAISTFAIVSPTTEADITTPAQQVNNNNTAIVQELDNGRDSRFARSRFEVDINNYTRTPHEFEAEVGTEPDPEKEIGNATASSIEGDRTEASVEVDKKQTVEDKTPEFYVSEDGEIPEEYIDKDASEQIGKVGPASHEIANEPINFDEIGIEPLPGIIYSRDTLEVDKNGIVDRTVKINLRADHSQNDSSALVENSNYAIKRLMKDLYLNAMKNPANGKTTVSVAYFDESASLYQTTIFYDENGFTENNLPVLDVDPAFGPINFEQIYVTVPDYIKGDLVQADNGFEIMLSVDEEKLPNEVVFSETETKNLIQKLQTFYSRYYSELGLDVTASFNSSSKYGLNSKFEYDGKTFFKDGIELEPKEFEGPETSGPVILDEEINGIDWEKFTCIGGSEYAFNRFDVMFRHNYSYEGEISVDEIKDALVKAYKEFSPKTNEIVRTSYHDEKIHIEYDGVDFEITNYNEERVTPSEEHIVPSPEPVLPEGGVIFINNLNEQTLYGQVHTNVRHSLDHGFNVYDVTVSILTGDTSKITAEELEKYIENSFDFRDGNPSFEGTLNFNINENRFEGLPYKVDHGKFEFNEELISQIPEFLNQQFHFPAIKEGDIVDGEEYYVKYMNIDGDVFRMECDRQRSVTPNESEEMIFVTRITTPYEFKDIELKTKLQKIAYALKYNIGDVDGYYVTLATPDGKAYYTGTDEQIKNFQIESEIGPPLMMTIDGISAEPGKAIRIANEFLNVPIANDTGSELYDNAGRLVAVVDRSASDEPVLVAQLTADGSIICFDDSDASMEAVTEIAKSNNLKYVTLITCNHCTNDEPSFEILSEKDCYITDAGLTPIIEMPEEPWYVKHTFDGVPYEGVVKYVIDVPPLEPGGSVNHYSVTTDREFTPDEIKAFEAFIKNRDNSDIITLDLVKDGEKEPYYTGENIIRDYQYEESIEKEISVENNLVSLAGNVEIIPMMRATPSGQGIKDNDINYKLTATLKSDTKNRSEIFEAINAELNIMKSELNCPEFPDEITVEVIDSNGQSLGDITVADNGNIIKTTPTFEDYFKAKGHAAQLVDVEYFDTTLQLTAEDWGRGKILHDLSGGLMGIANSDNQAMIFKYDGSFYYNSNFDYDVLKDTEVFKKFVELNGGSLSMQKASDIGHVINCELNADGTLTETALAGGIYAGISLEDFVKKGVRDITVKPPKDGPEIIVPSQSDTEIRADVPVEEIVVEPVIEDEVDVETPKDGPVVDPGQSEIEIEENETSVEGTASAEEIEILDMSSLDEQLKAVSEIDDKKSEIDDKKIVKGPAAQPVRSDDAPGIG